MARRSPGMAFIYHGRWPDATMTKREARRHCPLADIIDPVVGFEKPFLRNTAYSVYYNRLVKNESTS